EVISLVRESIPTLEFCVVDGSVEPGRMPFLMQACDCLLFTSDYEGSPTMVQEAMACNLPVVSVPVGDVPERLRDVEPSCVTSGDPRELAAALAGILRDRRRSNGHGIARRELALQPIVRSLEGVYAAAAARRPRAPANSTRKSASAP